MLGAVTAVIWSTGASEDAAALDRALRGSIVTGSAADRKSSKTAEAAFSAYTMPSNKAGQPKPTARGAYRDADVAVVCDAVLTDPEALCAALGLPTATDPARIIAALYADTGEAGLDRLDGDFAFVLHDLQRDLVLARRDPFGVRPLFWAWLPGGGLAFASLPETLIDAGLIPAERDVEAVVYAIAGSSARLPQTLVKGLFRVPACTQMTFAAADAGTVPVPRTYWQPGAKPARVPRDFDGWTQELRHLMDRAVARRVPATGDLGASISSGLDSTAVTMLAERHLANDQHIHASTYAASEEAAAAYPGMMDETEVAQQVVAGSNRISWTPHPIEPFTNMPEPRAGLITWTAKIDGNPELAAPVAAAAQGADVMLTGWGGDNTISYKGYGTPAALMRKGQWRELHRMCQRQGRTRKGTVHFYAKVFYNLVVPEGTRLREWTSGPKRETMNYNHRMYTGLKPEFRAGSDLLEFRASDLRANRMKEIMSPVLAMRIEFLSCHGLRQGIRYVHPLLDRDLVNYSLTCPPQFEIRGGMSRAPVRAAMEGIVHDAARLRAHTGLPFVEIGLRIARLHGEMMEVLDQMEQDPRLAKYFDFDFVRESMERQPTEAQAEAHVKEVSTTGVKTQWPLNTSFIAIGNMMALQAALDEAEGREMSKEPGHMR